MSEEIKNQSIQKNTVATVGMRFSIIWLIAFISIILIRLWIPLLFIWLVLGIIWLFYKPRWKARVAVIIPLIVFIILASIICYIWSSMKTPAMQFANWAETQVEQFDDENFDENRFNDIVNEEVNNIASSMTKEDYESLIENSTWSNIIEKWSYMIFGLFQQIAENSFEKYKNGYIPETNNEKNNILSVDIDVENDENIEEKNESSEKENIEILNQTEENDIDQIINILE